MNKKIDPACLAGIIKPGEVYILNEEDSSEGDPGPIEYLYTIRCTDEIAPAIEMEMDIVMAEYYEYKEFLGVKKECENCYRFTLLCYDKKEEKEIEYLIYLHRICAFEEMLVDTKESFGVA
jgi:hypothetical protein